MLLMFFQLLMFGLYVAMGVVEEKSSRVVEVLLATIKPLHLLWGKVLSVLSGCCSWPPTVWWAWGRGWGPGW